MNEGKVLLLKIIESKQKAMAALNKDDLMFEDINLVKLSKDLYNSIDTLATVSDELIDKIISDNKYRKESFKEDITKLRDMIIGKRDYNLQVNFTKQHIDIYEKFMELLEKLLEKKVPGVINVEQIERECSLLLRKIQQKEIINDFKFIEKLAEDYNPIEKDANLIKIMKFINEHNLIILKVPKKNGPTLDVQYIRRPKLDDRIKEILEKLNINYKSLPNYLLGELKRSDAEELYKTYSLVKKNKAEQYGILHFVKKNNSLAKLILILYSTPDSIKSVIDALKDKDNKVDITSLKMLVNYALPVFFSKRNAYFKPKNYEFVHNIAILKKLGVNYRSLIKKTPLFITMNNEVLVYTLNYIESNGGDKKKIINKCYKMFALDPSIIIENVETLKKYGVDIKAYFAGDNYNLLKVSNLNSKIRYLKQKYSINTDKLDCELLNKLVIAKVYRECKNNAVIWGD